MSYCLLQSCPEYTDPTVCTMYNISINKLSYNIVKLKFLFSKSWLKDLIEFENKKIAKVRLILKECILLRVRICI